MGCARLLLAFRGLLQLCMCVCCWKEWQVTGTEAGIAAAGIGAGYTAAAGIGAGCTAAGIGAGYTAAIGATGDCAAGSSASSSSSARHPHHRHHHVSTRHHCKAVEATVG